MRELFLVSGLMFLGYTTESSIRGMYLVLSQTAIEQSVEGENVEVIDVDEDFKISSNEFPDRLPVGEVATVHLHENHNRLY